jgi:hypothetical protein
MFAKHFILLPFVFGIAIILLGCKSDTVTNSTGINTLDTSGFTYPFNIGNSWFYTRKISADDIHPDSILHYFSRYPVISNGSLTILYDTVIENIGTRCFLEVMRVEQRTFQSRTYLIYHDTALLMYAQRGAGFFGNPPFNVSVTGKYNLNDSPDETIYIYDPPIALLKYPVITGKSWVNPAENFTVTKKYEGYETITIGAGLFKCMKTSATYSIFPESPFYDYYCKFGMLKRYVFYDDALITNQWYPEGIGTADLTDDYIVNSFNIP